MDKDTHGRRLQELWEQAAQSDESVSEDMTDMNEDYTPGMEIPSQLQKLALSPIQRAANAQMKQFLQRAQEHTRKKAQRNEQHMSDHTQSNSPTPIQRVSQVLTQQTSTADKDENQHKDDKEDKSAEEQDVQYGEDDSTLQLSRWLHDMETSILDGQHKVAQQYTTQISDLQAQVKQLQQYMKTLKEDGAHGVKVTKDTNDNAVGKQKKERKGRKASVRKKGVEKTRARQLQLPVIHEQRETAVVKGARGYALSRISVDSESDDEGDSSSEEQQAQNDRADESRVTIIRRPGIRHVDAYDRRRKIQHERLHEEEKRHGTQVRRHGWEEQVQRRTHEEQVPDFRFSFMRDMQERRLDEQQRQVGARRHRDRGVSIIYGGYDQQPDHFEQSLGCGLEADAGVQRGDYVRYEMAFRQRIEKKDIFTGDFRRFNEWRQDVNVWKTTHRMDEMMAWEHVWGQRLAPDVRMLAIRDKVSRSYKALMSWLSMNFGGQVRVREKLDAMRNFVWLEGEEPRQTWMRWRLLDSDLMLEVEYAKECGRDSRTYQLPPTATFISWFVKGAKGKLRGKLIESRAMTFTQVSKVIEKFQKTYFDDFICPKEAPPTHTQTAVRTQDTKPRAKFKGQCHYCGRTGHKKRRCYKWLRAQTQNEGIQKGNYVKKGKQWQKGGKRYKGHARNSGFAATAYAPGKEWDRISTAR